MTAFLGIDGGGTKTSFLLIDADGQVLASHRGPCAYYLETGLEALQTMLLAGIQATLEQAGIGPAALSFAFIGLPSYGEDSALQPRLERIAADLLPPGRCRCDNDMVCAWAGALAGREGINIVAGTGSIAYGKLAARSARAGGWGELFGDEGSAYWIAREALTLFARMSDGRSPKTRLYEMLREHFQLTCDLDLCAAVYGPPALPRSEIGALAPLVGRAAQQGDSGAHRLFVRAAQELASLVDAVGAQLEVPSGVMLPVSYSGGLFRSQGLLKPLLESALLDLKAPRRYSFKAPRLTPAAGAALYAAQLAGAPLTAHGVANLAGTPEGAIVENV